MKKLRLLIILLMIYSNLFSQNITLLGHLPYGDSITCSGITGYADAFGREYALIGNTNGVSVVDISIPYQPNELFLIPGAKRSGTVWREIAVRNGYAYITTESASGLVIANLNYLPDTILYHTVNPDSMLSAHTIFIDEKGIAYLNGSNRGLLFIDLNIDPYNPVAIGRYTESYVHDCFVRGDTLWAACINEGKIKVIDVHDKSNADNPINTLADWSTPYHFTHNCWLSDDSRYLFTTDERSNAPLTCYDVSDLNNPIETARITSNAGSLSVIHNTYYLNDYTITSHYSYGVVIHDVSDKTNLVEIGDFDTSPNYSHEGFNGQWGVWPYLPSGNIICSDKQTGLWILHPHYHRASHLQGIVTDSSNALLNDVKVEILNYNKIVHTNYTGTYKTGIPGTGVFSVRFSKPGFKTEVIDNLSLINSTATILNVTLYPAIPFTLHVKVIDSLTGNTIPYAKILVKDAATGYALDTTTNAEGLLSVAGFMGEYCNFYAGKWGYATYPKFKRVTGNDTIVLPLGRGYYDDALLDLGWQMHKTFAYQKWERAEPVVTTTIPMPTGHTSYDVEDDIGDLCFTTGNSEYGQDSGYATLVSPVMDLSGMADPYIEYYRWLASYTTWMAEDCIYMKVYLTNGVDSVLVRTYFPDSDKPASWKKESIRVKNYTSFTSNMRLAFVFTDSIRVSSGNVSIDKFRVTEYLMPDTIELQQSSIALTVYPNPFNNHLHMQVTGVPWQECTIEINETTGKAVYTQQLYAASQVIDIKHFLPSGLYIVRLLQNGQTVKTTKLIKIE